MPITATTRRQFLKTLGAGAATLALPKALGADEPSKSRPNIVFIFVDDLGFGDLSCYGNDEITTPHIDSLARDGVRFTQFYVNSPICSPSRVAVTTGQYPQRWRTFSFLADRELNRRRCMTDWLDPNAVTLARLLKRAGYATGHFGKWHMGGGRDVDDAPLPQAYGFDESLVAFEGLGDRLLIDGHNLSEASAKLGHGQIIWADWHPRTGMFLDRAIDFIRRHKNQFFYVNLWPNDIHDPHAPSQAQLDKFAHLAGEPQWQKFYAVLDELDRQLGRLLNALDELGLSKETVIVFAGDNGPTAWPHYYEKRQDDRAAPGLTGGLRGRKWSLYEGGIREPFIVRWQGTIPAGKVNDTTVVAGIDLLPSLCALAGVKPPEDYSSDGLDLSAALLGKAAPLRQKPIMWEYGRHAGCRPFLKKDQSPHLAIRDGRWKLLMNARGSDMQLYNLQADVAEQTNVADEYPSVAKRLSQQLLEWDRALP
jgi:arylsulfatase A-like enzyme